LRFYGRFKFCCSFSENTVNLILWTDFPSEVFWDIHEYDAEEFNDKSGKEFKSQQLQSIKEE
jgi:hypothetical protein